MRKAKANATPVESVKHHDKRANIPTEELRDFVADDEATPKTLLYPRDPSLDPQLVWKGKDEQDHEDLRVPSLPVYIQEVIEPKALVEALRAQAKEAAPAEELDFFGDVGPKLAFEDMVDFYHHEEDWTNRMILGDSLLVMASFAEKEGLKGKVQMIYFDPPYGIKFGSNWQVSTRKRDVKDGKAEDLTRQPEQIRAFRDTWKLGIHSYLSYLRDRLVLARELLSETGSIFVQIGEENVHRVRALMDEVFGDENYCSTITTLKTTGAGSPAIATDVIPSVADYVLWYAKSAGTVKYRRLYFPRRPSDDANYRMCRELGVFDRALGPSEMNEVDGLPPTLAVFSPNPLTSQTGAPTTTFAYNFAGRSYVPGKGGWKTNIQGMSRLAKANRLMGIWSTLRFTRFFLDFSFQSYNNLWTDTRQSGFGLEKIYVVQSPHRLIERCLLMTTDPGDLVLDPTCGSGTTAYVAEQWGRRWLFGLPRANDQHPQAR